MKKLFVVILIIFLGLGAAGFFFYQKNKFSKEIMQLEILAPSSVEMAKDFEYIVKYKNNGETTLEDVNLYFEYPQDSLTRDSQSLIIEKKLDDIYPGQEGAMKFKASLLGKEGEIKVAKASLGYKPKGLEAKYKSETTFIIQIGSVPLTFEFDMPSRLETSRPFDVSLNYFSNSSYSLSDIRIKIENPEGFEVMETRPAPLWDSEWKINNLEKADGGRIRIKGKIQGKESELKTFKAQFGIWRDDRFIVLKEASRNAEIAKSSIYISQLINGLPEYTADAGDNLHYEIFLKNIGDRALENLFLVARPEGEFLDYESVKSDYGEYKIGDNSIIWDPKKVPDLKILESQEEVKFDFWVRLKGVSVVSSIKNPIVKNTISVDRTEESFETKINSKLTAEQKGYFQDEVFGNSGPTPPAVGQSTTYTILWQVKNYYNDVKNVKVKAVLPNNAKLTGKIFPEDSKLTFDSESREIVWDVGDMEAGKGVSGSAPNVAFQIILTPDENQKGKMAQLIGEMKVAGEDDWTKDATEGTFSGLEIKTAE